MHTIPGALRGLPLLVADGAEVDDVTITRPTRASAVKHRAPPPLAVHQRGDHFDWRAVGPFAESVIESDPAIGLAAFAALFRFKVGIIPVVLGCGMLGVVFRRGWFAFGAG